MCAGVLNAAGYALIGATLKYHAVWIPIVAFIFLVGIPQGITTSTTAIIAKEKATPARIGTIFTLINAGNSIGILVLPHLNNFLLFDDGLGLDIMFYVLASLMILPVLVGYFMPESKQCDKVEQEFRSEFEDQNRPNSSSVWSWKIFKTKFFILFVTSQVLFFIGYMSMMPLLAPLLKYYGFTTSQIPNFLLVLAGCEFLGRLVYAFVLIRKINGITLLMATFILHAFGMAISLFCLLENANRTVIIVFSFAITGFSNGGFGGLMYKVLGEYITPDDYPTAFSMQHIISFGFGLTAGPFIGSGLVDLFSSDTEEPYWVAYAFGVSSVLVAVVIAFFMKGIKRI